MNEEQRRLVADGYRQMPDEKLAALLAESSSLTEQAKQALLDVIDERPSAAAIKVSAEKMAARNTNDAGERPGLGFWLGFLIFGFCMAPIRYINETVRQFDETEKQYPQLLEIASWQTYRIFSWILLLGVVVAGAIAIHAIAKGTARRDLSRILGPLWFNALGITLLDLAATALLFGWEAAREGLSEREFLTQSVIAIIFACLWSSYLIMSDRCRRRYPRQERNLTTA